MKCLGWKSAVLLIICGLCLVVIGEMLRISAMLTASRSFSHTLEWRRREDHSLVTTGVYSLCRHPSYAGISSQLAYTSISHSVNYCGGPLSCTSNQLKSTVVARCASPLRSARVGWYVWAIGTQVMLANPVCAVGFAVAAQRFFADRVLDEERLLLQMFGAEYERYQQLVPHTGVPFVRGYRPATATARQ